jgi:phosphate transport system permease protein
MLVGCANVASWSLFSPAHTLAALLALNFSEASTEMDIAVLMYAALILLLITLVVNICGSVIIQKDTARLKQML